MVLVLSTASNWIQKTKSKFFAPLNLSCSFFFISFSRFFPAYFMCLSLFTFCHISMNCYHSLMKSISWTKLWTRKKSEVNTCILHANETCQFFSLVFAGFTIVRAYCRSSANKKLCIVAFDRMGKRNEIRELKESNAQWRTALYLAIKFFTMRMIKMIFRYKLPLKQ